ncbi:Rieske 2Fe-2S domain-containing protein [Rhodoferax sp. GW822-FHT02A01]|uniref:Rieske 2Fe-2S domain-containing protein n=1 Tax=Rhodoferax sp. GW822-FHT02A01 TaxID=3141537 RepID=UPI00315CC44F
MQTDFEPALPTAAVAIGQWHIAAQSHQLEPHKPLGVSVMSEPVVLYRKKDGAPVALEDRCPHRWALLSGGRVDGDNIVCPYHGFKFCPRGHLIEISGKSGSPSMDSARVYAVIERDSLIWVWVGDGDPTSAAI